MTTESAHALRVAELASVSQVALTAAYFLTGILWLSSSGPGVDPFQPSDPYLAVLEVLIIASAVAFIFLAAAAYVTANEFGRPYGAAGLGFSVIFAALTCSAHFAQLTVLTRSPASIVIWPSVPMALDLLAWDLFFGIALVCIAIATSNQQAWPRSLLLVGGMFCIAGTSGPASGHLKLHLLATVGYAVIFPVACFVIWLRIRAQRVQANAA